jgi:hypothetical protein
LDWVGRAFTVAREDGSSLAVSEMKGKHAPPTVGYFPWKYGEPKALSDSLKCQGMIAKGDTMMEV